MSASWLQLVAALAVMYLVVAAAGIWGRQKRAKQRAQQEAEQHDRHDH